MKRFWMSWIVSEEDYRPLTYPPNDAIIGWWCSGYTGDDKAIICGLVRAEDEAKARAAVVTDWPGICWRFVEDGTEWQANSRFPVGDGWMKERLEAQS